VELTDTDGDAPGEFVVRVAQSRPSNMVSVHFEEVPRPERVAPSTTEADARASRRRDALERLQDRPSIWDEL